MKMNRLLAFVVAANLAVVALPHVPAEASPGLTAIDPLQSATTLAGVTPANYTATPITTADFDPPATPPIAFVPFPQTDPKTGQAVASAAPILAPSGVTVSAGTYWTQVNALEKFFNSRGVSLRKGSQFDLGTIKGGTQAELESTKNANPDEPGTATIYKGTPADLTAIALLAPKPSDLDPSNIVALDLPVPTPKKTAPTPTPPPVDSLPLGYKSEGRKALDPLPTSQDRANVDGAGGVKYSKSKKESYGSKNYNDFYLSASISAETANGGAESMHGEVAMGAQVFGQGGDIAKASIEVSPSNDSVDIEAIGQSLYSKSGKNPLSDQFTYSGIFGSIGLPISTGESGLYIGASISGIVGVGYAIDSARTDSVSFGPIADIAGAFNATMNLEASNFLSLQAGVTGNLTIAEVTLPLIASAGFVVKDYRSGTSHSAKSIWACRLHYTYGLKAELQYKILVGDLKFTVGGCVIICKTGWAYTFFNWKGFTGKDTLFSDSGDKAVGDLYSDLPEYGYHTTSSAKVVFSKDDSSGIPSACHDLYDVLGQPQPT